MTSIPSALTNARLMSADRVVVWAQRDVFSQEVSGASTSLATCATKAFGHDLLQWMPLGDDRVLFVDGAPSGSPTGTLRAASVSGSGVGSGTPLANDVSVVFAPLAPGAVIYAVARGTADDGLFVYAGPLLGASTSPGTR